MIHSLLTPSLLSLASLPLVQPVPISVPALTGTAWEARTHVAATVQGAKPRITTTSPDLYVEGRPFIVSVEVANPSTKSAEVPTWHLTAAAWDVDGKELGRREGSGALAIAPGQTLRTQFDVGPAIQERVGEGDRDFRIRYSAQKSAAKEVIFLAQPESGIDFETLPKVQLSDYQVILQTSSGPIWVELWPDVAPNHVRNFLDLCSTGFYDGSPFHRVVPGFMVQGGRAKDGSAAPRKLDQEFSTRRHAAGVLSAARLDGDDNSATSEFFVVHQASPHLDGKYSAFGRVITGEPTVEKLVKSVEVHYALINALARNRVPIDPNSAAVAGPMSKPNPKQEILEALVVKATKSRPKEPR